MGIIADPREVFRHEGSGPVFDWSTLGFGSATHFLFGCRSTNIFRYAEYEPEENQRNRAAVIATTPDSVADSCIRKIVAEFCEDVPHLRVAPMCAEMNDLLRRCSTSRNRQPSTSLEPLIDDVSCLIFVEALHEQLGSVSNDNWQVRFRALCLITHLFGRGERERRLAVMAMGRCHELVRHLSVEVQECKDYACRLLLIWQMAQILPPGEDIRAADRGGILNFTAPSCASTCSGCRSPADTSPRLPENAKKLPSPRFGTPAKVCRSGAKDLRTTTPCIDLLGLSLESQYFNPNLTTPTTATSNSSSADLITWSPRCLPRDLEFDVGSVDAAVQNLEVRPQSAPGKLKSQLSAPTSVEVSNVLLNTGDQKDSSSIFDSLEVEKYVSNGDVELQHLAALAFAEVSAAPKVDNRKDVIEHFYIGEFAAETDNKDLDKMFQF